MLQEKMLHAASPKEPKKKERKKQREKNEKERLSVRKKRNFPSGTITEKQKFVTFFFLPFFLCSALLYFASDDVISFLDDEKESTVK